MKQQPRLMRGGLSNRVFVVTRYKDLGDGMIEALEKYDVTDDFDVLASRKAKWRIECPMCHRDVAVTKSGNIQTHSRRIAGAIRCDMSRQEAPSALWRKA